MEEKIIKKPPTAVEKTLPAISREKDEPRPVDVGGIFKKVLIPPAQKEEG